MALSPFYQRETRPVLAKVVGGPRAALKPAALQTLRACVGASNLAKRLDCACLQHRF